LAWKNQNVAAQQVYEIAVNASTVKLPHGAVDVLSELLSNDTDKMN